MNSGKNLSRSYETFPRLQLLVTHTIDKDMKRELKRTQLTSQRPPHIPALYVHPERRRRLTLGTTPIKASLPPSLVSLMFSY